MGKFREICFFGLRAAVFRGTRVGAGAGREVDRARCLGCAGEFPEAKQSGTRSVFLLLVINRGSSSWGLNISSCEVLGRPCSELGK